MRKTLSSISLLALVSISGLLSPAFSCAQSPSVSTGGASVGFESALLFGTVTAGQVPASVWFEYGSDQSVGRSTKVQEVTIEPAEQFSIAIDNLEPYRTYYYRAVAYNRDGITRGEILRFTAGSQTVPSPVSGVISPIVLTRLPDVVTTRGVRLKGLALPGERVATTGWFEWGTSYTMSEFTPDKKLGSNASMEFSYTLTGLSANTRYYYRAAIQNKNGLQKGAIMTFVTPPSQTSAAASSQTPADSAQSEPGVNVGIYTPSEPAPEPVLHGVAIEKNIMRICSVSCRKVSNNTAALGGEIIEYQILIKNTGMGVLHNVVVEDDVSEFAEFVNASHGGTFHRSQKKVSWMLNALDPSEVESLSLSVRVRKFPETMTTVTIASVEVGGSRAMSNAVTLRVVPPGSASLLSLVPDTEYPHPGDTQTYTIFLRNNMGEPLKNVRFTVSIPQGLAYVPEDDNDITVVGNVLMYRMDAVASDEEKKFAFKAAISKEFQSGDTIPLTVVARFDADRLGTLDAVAYTIDEIRLDEDVVVSAAASRTETAVAFFGASGSFPGSAILWLIFVICALVIILLVSYLLEFFARRREAGEKMDVAPPGFHF